MFYWDKICSVIVKYVNKCSIRIVLGYTKKAQKCLPNFVDRLNPEFAIMQ